MRNPAICWPVEQWVPTGSTWVRISLIVKFDLGACSLSWPGARSKALVEIQSLLTEVQPRRDHSDTPNWVPAKSGIYHTGATWSAIRQHRPHVPWYTLVWFKNHTPRHLFIVWLALPNRLTTRDRLVKWLPQTDTTCVLCGGMESRNHLFFECSYSKLIWEALTLQWAGVPSSWSSFIS